MGRVWWCACGSWQLWSFEVLSRHNSQHLLDPYTPTHLQHGIGFYFLTWLLLSGWLGSAARFFVAMAVEAVWEVVENTAAIIEQYREVTISLDYYGDSIINSLADMARLRPRVRPGSVSTSADNGSRLYKYRDISPLVDSGQPAPQHLDATVAYRSG